MIRGCVEVDRFNAGCDAVGNLVDNWKILMKRAPESLFEITPSFGPPKFPCGCVGFGQ